MVIGICLVAPRGGEGTRTYGFSNESIGRIDPVMGANNGRTGPGDASTKMTYVRIRREGRCLSIGVRNILVAMNERCTPAPPDRMPLHVPGDLLRGG